MSRRREVAKREIIADAKYGSRDIAKFVNVVMKSGKKSVAERIVYGALAEIEKKTKRDPAEVLAQAVENVRPQVEVKSRRVGGANYQVPVEVRASRGVALAMRWLRRAMRGGAEKAPTAQRLARELLDAVEGRGAAVKKRDEVHRMAAANKAFSHFRF